MSVSFSTSPELKRNIKTLQNRFGIRYTRTLLRRASKPLLQEAKQNSLGADSSKSIYKALALVNERGEAAIRLGVRLDKKYGTGNRKRTPFYYHMLENGVRPHTIEARKKPRLAFTVNGRFVRPTSVQHTGLKPRPFLRPAWDKMQQVVYKNVADEVRKGIFK